LRSIKGEKIRKSERWFRSKRGDYGKVLGLNVMREILLLLCVFFWGGGFWGLIKKVSKEIRWKEE
jgi:hypothetical protein